jgi:subtilisin family serine protease
LQGYPAFTSDGDPYPQNLAFQEQISRLQSIGAVIVVAAGNEGAYVDDVVPASLGGQNPALIVVGSADFDNKVSDSSPRSRQQGIVSLYGFGGNTWCAGQTADDVYVSLGGTSMAAAQVAGLAAEKLKDIPAGTAVADIPGLVKRQLQEDGLIFRGIVDTPLPDQQIAPLASTGVGIRCDISNEPLNPLFPLAPIEAGLFEAIPQLAPISFGDGTTLDLVEVDNFVCYLRIRV